MLVQLNEKSNLGVAEEGDSASAETFFHIIIMEPLTSEPPLDIHWSQRRMRGHIVYLIPWIHIIKFNIGTNNFYFTFGNDHITVNTPVLVRSLKLSTVELG